MKHGVGLRVTLITLIVICMAPVFLMAGYESVGEQRLALEKAQFDLRHHAEMRAAATARLVEGVRAFMLTVAQGPETSASPAACGRYLRSIHEHLQEFAGFGIANPDGKVWCRSTSDRVPLNIAERSYFKRAVSSGQLSIGDYSPGLVRQKPCLVMAMPILKRASLSGVLFLVVDMPALKGRFDMLPSAPQIRDVLTDAAGVVLVSSPGNGAVVGERIAHASILKEIETPSATPMDAQAPGLLYSIRIVKPDGGGALAIVSLQNRDQVLADVHEHLHTTIGVMLLTTFAACAFAWLLAARMLGRPMERLLAKVKALEEGHASLIRRSPREDWEVRELTVIEGGLDRAATTLAARAMQRDSAVVALEDSERRYRAQFESAPQPMWVYDAESLAFLVVNEAAITHYGYSRDEFMRMTLRDIRPPEDVPQLIQVIGETRERTQSEARARHKRRDGEIIHVELALHAIEWEGRSAGTVIAYDVTSCVKAEQAWAQINRTLEAQVRRRTEELQLANSELEAFSYSVSHDLRGPVAAIQAFCGVLAKRHGASLPPEAAHYVQRISAGASQMNELIVDLLSLSRVAREPIQTERVDLAAVAGTVVAGLRERFPQREVEVSIENALYAMCDRRLITVVFENLIGNAWKFTSQVPHAQIRIARHAPAGQWTTIVVADNGAGFDSAYSEKLFKPFQRLHSASEFEGTGIGLAIVQRVVVRLGGKVWAESTAGQGARFYVSLPEPRHAPAEERQRARGVGPSGAPERR
jgi:PAS domain S-box-containing protein